MHQQRVTSSIVIALMVLSLLAVSIQAYPSARRAKRVSDQRLAELQTMLALARLKSRLPTNGKNGYVDVSKIGRKKRSQEADDAVERTLVDSNAYADAIVAEEGPSPSSDWSYYDWGRRLERG